MNNKTSRLISFWGILFIPIVWVFCKDVLNIPDRYLPSILQVISAFKDIEPNVFVHFFVTLSRLLVGMVLGILVGVFLGILLYYSSRLNDFLSPFIQSIRSIPAIATVPFFILWFGFSEFGKYFLVTLGISLNIAISSYQILSKMPEKYSVFSKGFQIKLNKKIRHYSLPTVLEHIYPTIRFSLSTAIGLVIVSELLGSQIGLGYLIQTSRSTFSIHVIFLAVILLGIMNFTLDLTIKYLWKKIIFWQKRQ
ncbi:MAG: ABC transporter permease [Petrimonas sp.]|jgi:ABC-type nitrate/sulfonate/bicarbonate transport system permease component